MKNHMYHHALLAGVLLWLAPSVGHAANLLKNGSFENDNATQSANATDSELSGTAKYAGAVWGDYTATNWSKTSRVWFVTKGTEIFPDGNYAYILDGQDNGGKDVLAQGGLSLTAGKTYKLTFALWGWTGVALTENLDVRFTYGYSNLTDSTSGTGVLVLDNKTTVGNDGKFEYVTAWFTPSVSTNYALQFIADTNVGDVSANHIWIDNVVLDETDNYIYNGSFEYDNATTTVDVANSELPGSANYAGAQYGYYTATGWSKTTRIWFTTKGTENFPDGSYAYRIDGSLTGGSDVLAQGGLPLMAGTTYKLTFALWCEDAAPQNLDVRFTYGYSDILNPTNGTGVLVLDNKTPIYDSKFEYVTALFTPTVSTNYALQFIADTVTTLGHVWVDNVSLRKFVPPSTWNVGNGVWDTVSTNWLSGGALSVWSNNAGDAIFTNAFTPITVIVTNTQSAAALMIGTNNDNCAFNVFSSATGSALSASSVLIQGKANYGPGANATIFTNLNLTCSGDVGVGRWTLLICGDSVVTVNRFVSSELMGVLGNDNQWAALTIKGNASVVANNGVAYYSYNNLTLQGGSLSVPVIKVPDDNTQSRTRLDGGRLVALASTNDFIQISNTSGSYLPSGVYVATNGAWIDTGTNTVAITKPLKHDETGGATDGGLVKLGSGTLTLSGTNTYNGATVVSNGTLSVNGALTNANITVSAGATLTGSGTLRCRVSSASNNRITVSGTATLSNLTLALDVQGLLSEGSYVLATGLGSAQFKEITNMPQQSGFSARALYRNNELVLMFSKRGTMIRVL